MKIDEHLKDLTKNCSAAILADNRSLVGLDEFPIDDVSDESVGRDDWSPKKLTYNHILRWMYNACYKMNLETDIVYKEDVILTDPEAMAKKYPLLIVPALYSATKELIDSLRKYIEKGGNLVLGFKSLVSDEELKIYPDVLPYNMTDIIGGTYDQFTRPVDTTIKIDGREFNVSHWMELLRPQGTGEEVWGTYVHPCWDKYAAVLHNKLPFSGSVTYIGCYMQCEGLTVILKKLIRRIGLSLPEESFPIIVKSGTNTLGEKITYYFNFSSKIELISIYKDCTELISSSEYHRGDKISIGSWSVKIFVNK